MRLARVARLSTSALPPSSPTREEDMRKSSSAGALARSFAMATAPASPLMLLWRCSFLSLCGLGRSSKTAAHAPLEPPMFCRRSSSSAVCVVSALPHARIPFSPSALSLRSSFVSDGAEKALQMVVITSIPSVSGRPATMSLITSSSSCCPRLRTASATTSAASRPKLFPVSVTLRNDAPGARSGESTARARSAVRNSRSLPPELATSKQPAAAPAPPPVVVADSAADVDVDAPSDNADLRNSAAKRTYSRTPSSCGRPPAVVANAASALA
mmetsp:Transcript_29255/g.95339  ORF Transcript_29255/g.95339 Transcript_29255/m.95339 type:complete len:271 (-) Transcript_29255:138-950(-)